MLRRVLHFASRSAPPMAGMAQVAHAVIDENEAVAVAADHGVHAAGARSRATPVALQPSCPAAGDGCSDRQP